MLVWLLLLVPVPVPCCCFLLLFLLACITAFLRLETVLAAGCFFFLPSTCAYASPFPTDFFDKKSWYLFS